MVPGNCPVAPLVTFAEATGLLLLERLPLAIPEPLYDACPLPVAERSPLDDEDAVTPVAPDLLLVVPADDVLDAVEEAVPVPLTEPRTLAPEPTVKGPDPTLVVALLLAVLWALPL